METAAMHADYRLEENISWIPVQRPFLPAQNVITAVFSSTSQFEDADFGFFRDGLNPAEKEKADAFISLESKKQYLLCHYLLRQLLSSMTRITPEEIKYFLTENGKPFLTGLQPPVYFNVSHASEKVLLAFSYENELGADLERKNPDFDFMSFAKAHFSSGEFKALEKSPGKSSDFFFLTWTRKEAILKLTGQGLCDDLKSIDTSSSSLYSLPRPVFVATGILEDYAFSIAAHSKKEIQFYTFLK